MTGKVFKKWNDFRTAKYIRLRQVDWSGDWDESGGIFDKFYLSNGFWNNLYVFSKSTCTGYGDRAAGWLKYMDNIGFRGAWDAWSCTSFCTPNCGKFVNYY